MKYKPILWIQNNGTRTLDASNQNFPEPSGRVRDSNNITPRISVIENLRCRVKSNSFGARSFTLFNQCPYVASVQKHRLDDMRVEIGPENTGTRKVIRQSNGSVILWKFQCTDVFQIFVSLVDFATVVVSDQEEVVVQWWHCNKSK